MKKTARVVLALILASAVLPLGAASAHVLSDYVVYGERGIVIGVGSIITGRVGAKFNDPVSGRTINMNGLAQVVGDADSGDNAPGPQAVIFLGNNAEITGTLTRGPGATTLTNNGAVGTDVPLTDPQLPTIPAASVTPCPTGGADQSGANNQTRNLTPGSFGAFSFGSGFNLNFTQAGVYKFDSITTGNGATITAVPGVIVQVCGNVQFGSVTVLPDTLLSGDVTWEIDGNDPHNAFRAGGGSRWIGDVLTPNGGIHIGSGGSVASFTAHLHAKFLVDIEHGVIGHNGGGGCCGPNQPPDKDATIFHALKNENNGANLSLRVDHQVAALIGFNLSQSQIQLPVTSAILRLTICNNGVADFCPTGSVDWPAGGGQIFAYRLNEGFEDWVEGNGNNFPIKNNPHGTGPGVTWNCKTDTNVANVARDCTGIDFWQNGGQSVDGPPRGPAAPLITNGMANLVTVDIDVTADFNAGLGTDTTFMSWFIREPSGIGFVAFYSKEGAQQLGNLGLAPQLIITP